MHRAWRVLAGCCILQIGITGIGNNTLGLYLTPVRDELGITTAQMSGFFSIRTVVMAFAALIVYRCYRHFPIKPLLAVMSLIYAGTFAALTCVENVYQLYAVSAVMGLAGSFLMITPSTFIINNWFESRVGTAMGLGVAASGIGGALMNPVSARMIEGLGWKTAILITVALMITICFITVFSLIVYKPSDVGCAPYREAGKEEGGRERPGVKAGFYEAADASGKRALTALMLIMVPLLYLSSQYTHIMPSYGLSLGLPMTIGGVLSSMLMLGNVAAKMSVGWCYDRFDSTKVTVSYIGIVIAAITGLLFSRNVLLICVCSLFFGMSMSFYTVCDPYLVRETYGSGKYDKVYSYYSMFGSLASSIYFTGVGYSYDLLHSYKPSFAFLIAVYLVAALTLAGRLHIRNRAVMAAETESLGG